MQADNPNRCQYVTRNGQCVHEAVQGQPNCAGHGGNAKAALKAYLITCKYLGDAPDRHLGADELKSLREEIALTRAMIEKRLNMVQSEAEFIASMPTFQGFMTTIEKLVTSCHNMEVKLGTLIGKAALLTLAQQIVEIISQNTQGIPGRDEIVEKISDEIVTLILKAENA